MHLEDLLYVLSRFFFGEVSLLGLSAFRIVIGLIIVIDMISWMPSRAIWFGPRGVLPRERWRPRIGRRCLSLFHVLPAGQAAVTAVIVATMIVAFLLMIGVWLPYTPGALFVLLISLHNRNIFILYGADAVLRLMLLLMLFAPVDGLSLDYYRENGALDPYASAPAWSLRLMQIQVCIIYWYAVLHKTNKRAWRVGTAVYYAMNNASFLNLPLPAWCRTPWFSRIATPAALITEVILVFALWIEETRLYAIGLGIGFHLALGYILTLHLFTPIMIACLLLFLSPANLVSGGIVAAPDAMACGVILAYMAMALFWDDPQHGFGRHLLNQYAGPLVRGLALHHSWALFAGDPPARASGPLQVVVQGPTGTTAFMWRYGRLVREGEHVNDPFFRHRFRKFEEAIARSRTSLRAAFLAYARDLAATRQEVSAIALFRILDSPAPPESRLAKPPPTVVLLASEVFEEQMARATESGLSCFAWNLARDGAPRDSAEIALAAAIQRAGAGLDPTPALGRLKWLLAQHPSLLRPGDRAPLLQLVQTHLQNGSQAREYRQLITALTAGTPAESTTGCLASVTPIPRWEPWEERESTGSDTVKESLRSDA